MSRDRIARLTDGQRDVLRMVDRHMETKEIARALGISPDGVNQRIKAAMRILGVNKRRDAARLLADAEGEERYQPLVYPSRDIEPDPDPGRLAPSAERERDPYPLPVGAMREPQAAFEVAPQPLRPKRFRLPLPIWGGRPGDLNAVQRLTWIFAVMLAIALAFGVFLAGMEALSRLGRAGS
ncbi:MAG TPA: helix-turn-helix transcriptional regulator [Allosphingosinicella sp.]|nr:helix-turn-helix transcriptional regulator [Allosphingosinicella sp.]